MNNNQIQLFVAGDFCPIHRMKNILQTTPNVELIFGDILPYIRNSDLAITNLECPITDHTEKIDKTGPALKGNIEALKILKEAGFNLLTLSNNHILDYGSKGLADTLNKIKESDLSSVGAGMDSREARKPYFYSKNGIDLAILNFSENEWSTTNGKEPGANAVDPISNYEQIKEAKKEAETVIVIHHGGHEMYQLPSPRMKSLFRFYVNAGANVVINHHPHVISGYEIYQGSPIFYSLGNFLFDNPHQKNAKWNIGMAIHFNISKNGIDFKVLSFEQLGKQFGINLHNGAEEKKIQTELESINLIIVNDELLESHFKNYIERSKRLYSSFIEPYRNRYLHALRNRNLLPSIWSKQKKLYLLNLIRCESHRDVLINLLKP